MFARFLKWLRGGKTEEAARGALTSLMSFAYSLLQQGDYVESRQVLLKALERRTEIHDPAVLDWILSCLAWTWDLSEQYRESVEFFSSYIERNPKESIAYRLRAGARWYSGDLREAVADYSKALELIPTDVLALSGRGQVLVERGEIDKAIQDLDAALAHFEQTAITDPGWRREVQAYVLNGRGAAYSRRGEFDRALADFEKSISLCPENAWVYYNRAETYEKRDDKVNALADYQRALTVKSPKLNTLRRKSAEVQVKTLLG